MSGDFGCRFFLSTNTLAEKEIDDFM